MSDEPMQAMSVEEFLDALADEDEDFVELFEYVKQDYENGIGLPESLRQIEYVVGDEQIDISWFIGVAIVFGVLWEKEDSNDE